MCRIILNPNNKQYIKKELEESYQGNGDGTGLYYFDKSSNEAFVFKWEKGTPFKNIWSKVKEVNSNKDVTNVCIHFRYGTSGGTGEEQTHPIPMNNNMYMVHNGVIGEFEWDRQSFSDTQCMAYWLDDYFKLRNITTIEQIKEDKFMCAYIADKFSGSKVVLLQGDKYIIFNANLGEEDKNGVWRSWKKITTTWRWNAMPFFPQSKNEFAEPTQEEIDEWARWEEEETKKEEERIKKLEQDAEDWEREWLEWNREQDKEGGKN